MRRSHDHCGVQAFLKVKNSLVEQLKLPAGIAFPGSGACRDSRPLDLDEAVQFPMQPAFAAGS
jgi:hypothetical protein